jgi:hypothetical protein
MAPSDCELYRDEILRRFIDGTPMSNAARSHYIGCVECIMAVSTELDKNAGTNGAIGNDPAETAAIQAAIQCGRSVLAREFGIPIPRPLESK